MDSEIKILHFSVRPYFLGGNGIRVQRGFSAYAIFNIVFKCNGNNARNLAERESAEYRKVHVAESVEKIENYFDQLELVFHEKSEIEGLGKIEFKGIPREEVFKEMWMHEPNQLVSYIEKFDVYRYYQYIEWNQATMGLIQEIENIRNGTSRSMVADYHHFFNILKAIDLFWH